MQQRTKLVCGKLEDNFRNKREKKEEAAQKKKKRK